MGHICANGTPFKVEFRSIAGPAAVFRPATFLSDNMWAFR